MPGPDKKRPSDVLSDEGSVEDQNKKVQNKRRQLAAWRVDDEVAALQLAQLKEEQKQQAAASEREEDEQAPVAPVSPEQALGEKVALPLAAVDLVSEAVSKAQQAVLTVVAQAAAAGHIRNTSVGSIQATVKQAYSMSALLQDVRNLLQSSTPSALPPAVFPVGLSDNFRKDVRVIHEEQREAVEAFQRGNGEQSGALQRLLEATLSTRMITCYQPTFSRSDEEWEDLIKLFRYDGFQQASRQYVAVVMEETRGKKEYGNGSLFPALLLPGNGLGSAPAPAPAGEHLRSPGSRSS